MCEILPTSATVVAVGLFWLRPSRVDKRKVRLYHIAREFPNSTPGTRHDCYVVS